MKKKTSALALTTLVGLSIALLTGCGLGGGATAGGGPNTVGNNATGNSLGNNGTGNIAGNSAGNSSGNATANETGNGTGNASGNNVASGNTGGNSTGNNTGSATANTTGNSPGGATGNSTGNSPGGKTGNSTGNGTGNSTSTPPSGNTTSTQTALSSMTVGSVTLSVPSNWTSTPTGGSGDFSGSKLTNPKDSNERIVVVSSACVGCYTDGQGKANPRLVIPEANATNVTVLNGGQSVSYTVPASNGGYPGLGMVTVSSNQSGYGYVEVYLPPSQSSLAAQILKSFTLAGQ